MSDYAPSALFVYSAECQNLCATLAANPYSVEIRCIALDHLSRNPESLLQSINHVVIAGDIGAIKEILKLAAQYHFSVGMLPVFSENSLIKAYELPRNINEAIELALRKNAQPMDLVRLNGRIVLMKATFGRLPLLDAAADTPKLTLIRKTFGKFIGLRLLRFRFETAGGCSIRTAATGCMVLHRNLGSLAYRVTGEDASVCDGAASLVITAPISILNYFGFLIQTIFYQRRSTNLPGGIGYIKSSAILIDSEIELDIYIDGKRATHTPVRCEAASTPIRVNVGPWLEKLNRNAVVAKEKIEIDHLPDKKELEKSGEKSIPFFSYASEERFRSLFISLRKDAQIDSTFVVLMILSTLLATIGLYLGSTAVIIGAMILAPLMAPIVSLAMGLLRQESELIRNSGVKIATGILIALAASTLITLAFPHKPITNEMQARLNPSLLDLAVAIVSGIAAAYSMSYREVIQSLAGVAIAVALVPPLSVAGIGIGRGDLYFFLQAFLLFTTNLVGIALAAVFTFRVLGYSPVVRSKSSIGAFLVLLFTISIPLYLSYERIVEKLVFEKSLKTERFLVNGKYIIIQDASISLHGTKKVILMDILARDHLTRDDLNQLKLKIQHHFNTDLIVRSNIIYIL